MIDKMRDDFEAEVLKNKAAFQIKRLANGDYQNFSTQQLWEYWQAATLAEREKIAAYVEKLTYRKRWSQAGINGVPISKCEIAVAIRRGTGGEG